MKNLDSRIRALEARMLSDPIVLFFADGSSRELRCGGRYLLTLLDGACRGALSPSQAEHLELIGKSVAAQEPGGAHMVEVVRCALYAQGEVQRSGTPDDC